MREWHGTHGAGKFFRWKKKRKSRVACKTGQCRFETSSCPAHINWGPMFYLSLSATPLSSFGILSITMHSFRCQFSILLLIGLFLLSCQFLEVYCESLPTRQLISGKGRRKPLRRIHKRKTTGAMPNTRLASASSFKNKPAKKATSNKKVPYIPRGVSLNGGEVLSSGVNVYFIWYGNWKTSQKSTIRNFINSMGSTNANLPNSVRRWYKTVTSYYDVNERYVSPSIGVKKEITDHYSYGKMLLSNNNVDNVQSIISTHITRNNVPKDPNGIYFLFTSRDVMVEGFCDTYCAYHSALYLDNDDATYVFSHIPYPDSSCLVGCGSGSVPSGDAGVDSIIDSLAHELAESVTNPDTHGGWYNSTAPPGQNEIGDICDTNYGSGFTTSTGQSYNLIGAKKQKFFAQSIWSAQRGACVLGTV